VVKQLGGYSSIIISVSVDRTLVSARIRLVTISFSFSMVSALILVIMSYTPYEKYDSSTPSMDFNSFRTSSSEPDSTFINTKALGNLVSSAKLTRSNN